MPPKLVENNDFPTVTQEQNTFLVPQTPTEVRQAGLENLVKEWLTFVQLDDKTPATVATYKKGIAVWVAWLTDNPVQEVTPRVVMRFKAALLKKYSPQTVNLRLAAVRSFYRWAVLEGKIKINPAASVKGAKSSKNKEHKRDALSDEQARALLACYAGDTLEDKRNRAIIALMLFCALRGVEVRRARVEDLRTRQGKLVMAVMGKNHIEYDQTIVIPPAAAGRVSEWYTLRKELTGAKSDKLFCSLSRRNYGGELSGSAVRAIVGAKVKALEIAGYASTHSLRHTAITNLLKHGGTMRQAQILARHESLDTTLIYAHEIDRFENPPEELISYE